MLITLNPVKFPLKWPKMALNPRKCGNSGVFHGNSVEYTGAAPAGEGRGPFFRNSPAVRIGRRFNPRGFKIRRPAVYSARGFQIRLRRIPRAAIRRGTVKGVLPEGAVPPSVTFREYREVLRYGCMAVRRFRRAA